MTTSFKNYSKVISLPLDLLVLKRLLTKICELEYKLVQLGAMYLVLFPLSSVFFFKQRAVVLLFSLFVVIYFC